MREPTPHHEIFGVIAEFDSVGKLLEGVRATRREGYRRIDAYSPFPVDGLAEAMGFSDNRIAWLTLIGGALGAALGFGMQAYTNLAFPIDIGGRPLIATPAFMLICFELMVLFAVLFAIGGMLAFNHLPRLHHPVFDVDAFHLASSDKFFLVIFSNDPRFESAGAQRFLADLHPARVDIVGRTEEPE